MLEGDLTVTSDGAVIEGLDVRGIVDIQASDVTIRGCFVRGPAVAPTSGSHALIQQFDPANTNLLVQGCNFRLFRCDVRRG